MRGRTPQIYIGSQNISFSTGFSSSFLALGPSTLAALVAGEIEFNCDIFSLYSSIVTGVNRGIQYGASSLPVYNGQRWGISWNYLNGSVNMGGGETYNGGSLVMCVDNNAGIRGYVSWIKPSDRRLKTEIQKIDSSMIQKLYSLNIYKFKYSNSAPEIVRNVNGIGVMADEIVDWFPYAILGESTEEGICYSYEDHPEGFSEQEMLEYGDSGDYTFTENGVHRVAQYYSVDYTSMVPILIAAINDLNTRVAELESR